MNNNIIPILTTCIPTTSITGGEETQRGILNDSIEAYANRNGLHLIDFTIGYSTDYTTDGIHPNPQGAAIMGENMYDALNGYITPVVEFGCRETNTTLLNTNPLMTGTGGAVSGSITGDVAGTTRATIQGSQSIYRIGGYVGDSVYMQCEVMIPTGYDSLREITCRIITLDSTSGTIYYQYDMFSASVNDNLVYAPDSRTIVLKTKPIMVTLNAERVIYNVYVTGVDFEVNFGRVERYHPEVVFILYPQLVPLHVVELQFTVASIY